jgi:hypothetical protein
MNSLMTGSALAVKMALVARRKTPQRREQQEEIRMNALMILMNFLDFGNWFKSAGIIQMHTTH